MNLKDLLEEVETLYECYGEDCEVKSFLNHNHAPSVFYSEDDDCVYVNV